MCIRATIISFQSAIISENSWRIFIKWEKSNTYILSHLNSDSEIMIYIGNPVVRGGARVYEFYTDLGVAKAVVAGSETSLSIDGQPLKGDFEEFRGPVIEELRSISSSRRIDAPRAADILRAMQADGDLARAQIEYQMEQRNPETTRQTLNNVAEDYRERGKVPRSYTELKFIALSMGYRI